MSRGWGRGSTREWRRVRAAVLADNLVNNGGRCTLAIPDVCTGSATCVHHTRGRLTTGDDRRFLAAACAPCNLKIGDPTRAVADPPGRSATPW